MAFDRTDPADLAALKTEIETDPQGYGYDPASTDAGVLQPINEIRDTITLNKDFVSPAEIKTATTYAAYDGLAIDEQEWLRWMTVGNGEPTLKTTPDLVARLSGNGGSSIWAVADRTEMEAAMTAILTRAGSRAEELFGLNTSITRDDWFAARDS